MNLRRTVFVGLTCFLIVSAARGEDGAEKVFSGPQPGEKLVPFKVKGVFDDAAGKDIDIVAAANGKPVLLVFFHKRTRPAFGLTNALMRYAAKRAKVGLLSGVVFLTDDPTGTQNWMKIVRRHFADGSHYGISPDGAEGPGAYGLNRNVTLTVLVAKDNKVTANFALVQPSLQADGPKIGKALADVLGGKPPTVAELGGERYNQSDADFRRLLAPVINKSAKKEDVDKAAARVEQAATKNPALRKRIGDVARRIIAANKLENYGTPAAQEYLRKWAKQFKPASEQRNREKDD